MKTTIETTEGKALVTFEGVMDSYIVEEVSQQLEPLYELTDTEITLDCTKLEYIASSGLRMFLLLLRETKANGCQILIKGVSPEVMTIFESTGFTKCFKFV